MWCRECGKELGRGWRTAPLCEDCAPNHSQCSCDFPTHDPDCAVHKGHDPYDIPF